VGFFTNKEEIRYFKLSNKKEGFFAPLCYLRSISMPVPTNVGIKNIVDISLGN